MLVGARRLVRARLNSTTVLVRDVFKNLAVVIWSYKAWGFFFFLHSVLITSRWCFPGSLWLEDQGALPHKGRRLLSQEAGDKINRTVSPILAENLSRCCAAVYLGVCPPWPVFLLHFPGTSQLLGSAFSCCCLPHRRRFVALGSFSRNLRF